MIRRIFISVLLLPILLRGQIKLEGTIVDENNKTLLPFVNIGIKNKNVGTICSEVGKFTLFIPEKHLNDSLTFSLVGYEEQHISINQILSSKKELFSLRMKPVQLIPVDVSVKRLKEAKYGISKTNPTLNFIDASTNQNDIFEIAQVIKLNENLSRITSINLLINNSSADTCVFRINFYEFDGHKPAKRLSQINILQKQIIKAGWLKIDLRNYNFYFKGLIVAAIEFIPTKKNNTVQYEVKLGGNSRSFVRSNSLGEWNTPPHHYRMFVTTLEETNKNKPDIEQEEEKNVPTTLLYSDNINDTFSIFINLPSEYRKNKAKKYPSIFLLDANVNFDIVNNCVKRINQYNEFVEPIVIGIGYKDFITNDSLRNRDYTYPIALAQDSFPVSGGALQFLAFIESELIPYIDKHYRTDVNNRTLMGHSLGGYFTLLALHKHQQNATDVFKNYVAASPSLDYHHQFLHAEFENIPLKSNNIIERNLLLTSGSIEEDADGGVQFNAFVSLLSKPEHNNIKLKKLFIQKQTIWGQQYPHLIRGLR